jgi:hypothetical protein
MQRHSYHDTRVSNIIESGDVGYMITDSLLPLLAMFCLYRQIASPPQESEVRNDGWFEASAIQYPASSISS